MNTWTIQKGYPVLTLTKNGDTYDIVQARFLTDSEASANNEPSPYDFKWEIPVTYISDGESQKKQVWFNMENAKIQV